MPLQELVQIRNKGIAEMLYGRGRTWAYSRTERICGLSSREYWHRTDPCGELQGLPPEMSVVCKITDLKHRARETRHLTTRPLLAGLLGYFRAGWKARSIVPDFAPTRANRLRDSSSRTACTLQQLATWELERLTSLQAGYTADRVV